MSTTKKKATKKAGPGRPEVPTKVDQVKITFKPGIVEKIDKQVGNYKRSKFVQTAVDIYLNILEGKVKLVEVEQPSTIAKKDH